MQAVLAVKPLESRLVLAAGSNITDLTLVNGDLRITDAVVGGHNETLSLSVNVSQQLVVNDPNSTFTATGINGAVISPDGHTVNLPLNLIAGKIHVDALGGTDSLNIDFTRDFFFNNHAIGINYNGGDPTTAPGDKITLSGSGTFGTITHTFTSDHDGTIQVGPNNGLVSYTGLEPIVDNLRATNRIFDFQGGSETINLDLGSAVGSGLALSVNSTAGESVAFNNPTTSLTIRAGTGNDTINIVRLSSNFSAALTVDGQDGTDSIFIASPPSTAVNANQSDMTFSAESFTVQKALTAKSLVVTADQIDIGATTTANSGITLRTDDASDTIGLGTSSGTFNLTATELSNLASNGLVAIGRTDSTATIDISGVNLSAENFSLTLLSGSTIFNGSLSLGNSKTLRIETGTISSPGAGTDVTIAGSSTLNIVSRGPVGSLLAPLTMSVGNLEVDTSAGTTDRSQFLSTAGSVMLTSNGLKAGNADIRLMGTGTFTTNGTERITDASSVIVDGATLAISSNTETVAGLRLISGSITGSGSGTLTSAGNFELESGTITAILGGNVDLHKSMAGTVTLTRAATYTGNTVIDAGTLKLGAANVIPNGAAAGSVAIAATGTLEVAGFAETINGLSGSGTVLNSASATTLTIGDNNATSTFAGSINGNINVVKIGNGTLSLDGSNVFTGTLSVTAGTLLVNGIKSGTGVVTVANNATLGGNGDGVSTGRINGNVTVAAGGTLAPGVGIGRLTIGGNVSFAAGGGGIFAATVNDTLVSASDYDTLQVLGTVTLNDATLSANGTSAGPGVTEIVLLNNDGADAIAGTFRNSSGATLAEGSLVTINGEDYRLSYKGGDGNDVVLSADTAITLVGNELLIRDVGPVSSDSLTITVSGNGYLISDPNLLLATDIAGAVRVDSHSVFVPFAVLTDNSNVFFRTGAGNDCLTIDFSGGDFRHVIDYDGEAPTGGTGDSLALIGGGTFTTVTHTFTSLGVGTIAVGSNPTIKYAGLEPILDNLDADNRIFNFNGGSETITIDLGSAVGSGLNNSIRSTLGESVAFNNPNITLVVNAGTGDDAVNLVRLDPNIHADVTLNGDDGNDTIDATTFAAAVTDPGTLTIHGNAGNDNVIIRSVGAISVSAFGDGGDNTLTVETTDAITASPLFAFAGFVFDQTLTPNVVTPVPVGTLAGGDGVVITSTPGAITPIVHFPADPTAGFNGGLSIGTLLGGVGGPRAVNLPAQNNGITVRSAVELSWNNGNLLSDVAGDDFVIYESSTNPTGPDAMMVQIRVRNSDGSFSWTRWRYERPDSRENYPTQGNEGAFATAFNISDFVTLTAGQTVDRIRIASMTEADRIDDTNNPATETGVATGQFRGEGFVIPDDDGVTSDVRPLPGDSASFDFFGNATFDPDPLYVGILHPLAAATNFRDDLVEVDDATVAITTSGIARPDIHYELFDTLSINTKGGTDEVIVHLGGDLPTTINIDGGDPATADKVTILGDDSLADDLSLIGSQVVDNGTGKVINLAHVESFLADVSGDVNQGIDLVTIERTFTLSGVDPSIHVKGDVTIDQMVVNTEPPPGMNSPTPIQITAVGVTFIQDSTPDVFVHIDNSTILPGGNGAIADDPAFESSSSTFPGGVQPGYDGNLSLGQLAFNGTNGTTRLLNMPGGNNGTTARSVFELTWSGSRTLTDGAGDDIVIYESGSAGDPEPFMIQVHRTDTTDNGGWSQWFYFPADAYDGAIQAFVTGFDLGEMGLAGVTIDAIRVANMIDADRMASPLRVGQVVPEVGGTALSRPLTGPTSSNPFGNYSLSSLDPDLIYVGVRQELNQPPVSGATQDVVAIDGDSVDVAGFIPITYEGLDQVTVNTGGGSDQITVTPAVDTQLVIHAETPGLPAFGGDRLEFKDLMAGGNPTLTVTDPGAATLTTAGNRDVIMDGIETFGIVDTPDGSGTPFTVEIDANSNLTDDVNDGGSDVFTIIGNDRNTDPLPNVRPTAEVLVNGTLVFRGDRIAIADLNLHGSSDDDTLTIDFERQNPIPAGGVHFLNDANGNNNPLDDGFNNLELLNGSADIVTHNFLNATDGNITIDVAISDNAGTPNEFARSLVTYDGLTTAVDTTSILDDLVAGQRIVNFTSAADLIRIADDNRIADANNPADSNSRSALVNADDLNRTFVGITFRNSTRELKLNTDNGDTANGGNDEIYLEAVDLAYRAKTIINADSGTDLIVIDDNGIEAGGSVDFVVFVVEVNGGGDTNDNLIVNDTSDTTGDHFNITENTIGGDDLPTGAVPGQAGSVGAIDWSEIPPIFVTGARPEINEQSILHWRFAEGSGILTQDLTSNNNDGHLADPPPNAPVFVFDATRGDNVLQFDGVNDFGTFADPDLHFGDAGTLSFWVKMDDQSRRNSFLNTSDAFPGQGMEFEYRQNNGGELFVYLNKSNSTDNSLVLENGATGTQVPNQGDWFNVIYTWDRAAGTAGEGHIYINGNEVAYNPTFDQTVTGWTPLETANLLFQLGRHRDDTSRFFKGSMDDVALFDSALTSAADRAAVIGGNFTHPDLLAHWSLDNAPGTLNVVADAGSLAVGSNPITLNLGSPVGGATFVSPAASGLTLPGTGEQLPALNFDGDRDLVVAPDSPSLDFDKSQGTISFWINPRGELDHGTIGAGSTTLIEDSSQQIEVGIFWQTDGGEAHGHEDLYGRLYFSPHENSLSDSTNIIVSNTRLVSPDDTLPADQWTHVTITWDFNATGGPQAHIYINGQDDGSYINNLPSEWTTVAGNTGNWIVGGDAAATPLSRDFDGKLADLTILGTAVSPAKVQDMFRNGAETTNPFDLAGTTGKFTWDSTNLYGRLDASAAGATTANGPFSGYKVEIYDSTGTTLLNTTTLTGTPASTSYEFAIPLSSLNNFNPANGGSLQYRITTYDFDNPAGGFDSVDTTLGFQQAPVDGRSVTTTSGQPGNLGVLNFTDAQNYFGQGGRVKYTNIEHLQVVTGSGNDTITIQDSPDPAAVANPQARTFTLQTGSGDDAVTIPTIDAGFKSATTILTEGGAKDSITQLADLDIGSTFSTGNVLYVAEKINLGADLTSTSGTATYDGAITLLTDVKIDTDKTEGQGGNILFSANTSIDSTALLSNELVLDAGTASVRFNANIGATANGSLGKLIVEEADAGVLFGNPADVVDFDIMGVGTISVDTAPLNEIHTLGEINIGSVSVIRGQGIVFDGAIATLAISTAGGNVRMNGAVTLESGVDLDTDLTDVNVQGGNVVFTNDSPVASALGEFNNFTLDAGTGEIFFNANLGGSGSQRLGDLNIDEADDGVVFGGLGLADVAAGDQGLVTSIRANGQIDIGTGTDFIGGKGILLNGGTSLVVSTTGDQVRMNGAVTLDSHVRIDTGTGAGDIVFTNDSPIDSQANETNNLTLQADGGTVRFNEDLGGNVRLGTLIVETANQVIFGEGDVDVAGRGTTGSVNLVRTNGLIDLGSASAISGGIVLNGGSGLLAMSTTSDTVRFNGPTTLASDASIDTEVNNAHTAGADITFTAVTTLDSSGGEFNDLTLDAGLGDITFNAIIGGTRALGDVTIEFSTDVNFVKVIRTAGDVVQLDGAGTTSLHGTLGTGIGGDLRVNTNEITLTAANVTTVGDVNLNAANLVSLTNNGGLNAGDSTIRIAANQDKAGNSRFVQDSSAIIRTANNSGLAVQILVGGAGDADISDIRAGMTSGGVQIVAGGGIVDNSASETPNIRAFNAILTAKNGIGAGPTGSDIDTAVAQLTAPNSRGDINLEDVNDLLLTGVETSTGRVNVFAAGILRLKDGTSVISKTGEVSNAPPILRFREANPKDVLIPGDPTQDIVGTIGGSGQPGDHLESGRNLTLVIVWGDGVVSRVTGLNAGDTLHWIIQPNGSGTPVIVHNATTTGPINVTITRIYPLQFLQGVTTTEVVATFKVLNDIDPGSQSISNIVLDDGRRLDLNTVGPLPVATAVSDLEFRFPPIIVVTNTITPHEVIRPNLTVDVHNVVDTRFTRYQVQEYIYEEKKEAIAQLFLVRVGPDGEEQARVSLPLSELQDLARLLNRLAKAPIPNGLYRIYHQEPGLPARKILEFRKTGESIGDPIREPGRGANPVEDGKPAEGSKRSGDVKPGGNDNATNASPAEQVRLALAAAEPGSFTRAARWRRGFFPEK